MNADTTLVTGASSGIGLHLAHEFASHGHPLVLIAPVEEELNAIATDIRARHRVGVKVIARDLEIADSAQFIFEELQRENVDIHILVNNAGHGFRGKWWEIPIDVDLSMIRLNIEAVLRLTKFFVQPMIERNRGKILNTASIAGFEPGPLLAVYHATKAFVLSWSEALATELQDTSITITALCPGPTDTDFFPKAGMTGTKAFQGRNMMAPQDVAKVGYKGLMDEQLFVVPGGMNKALVAARRFLSEGAQARLNQKYYEEVPASEQTRHRGDVELETASRK